MPIRDNNDFLMYYKMGFNRVYLDTMRCRHDPLYWCGPVAAGKHYLPSYQSENAQLPFQSARMLPFSKGNQVESTSPTELSPSNPQQHVIPMPLVERIIAISGIGRRPNPKFWYYSSELRGQWAQSELVLAEDDLFQRKFSSAATRYAEVFATLLPGLICKKNTPLESRLVELAWKGLSFLVEPSFLLEKLKEESRQPLPSEEEGGIKSLGDAIAVASKTYFQGKVGPGTLKAAESLKDIDERIGRQQEKIQRHKLPYQILSLSTEPNAVKFCLLGPIERYSGWAWNFSDDQPQIVKTTRFFMNWCQNSNVQPYQVIRMRVNSAGRRFFDSGELVKLSDDQLQVVETLPTSSLEKIRRNIEAVESATSYIAKLIREKELILSSLAVVEI